MTGADVERVGGAFSRPQVEAFLGEGLVPRDVGELSSLSPGTRGRLFPAMTGREARTLQTALTTPVLENLAATLSGPDIAALRTALGNDALLQQIAGAGGGRLQDLVAALGGADVRATATSLGAARFVEYAGTALTPAQLRQLPIDFPPAQLGVLEGVMSRQHLAAFYAAPEMGRDGLQLVHTVATNPRIQGVADWAQFEAIMHGGPQWNRSLGELRDALETVAREPAVTVRIGGDAQPVYRAGTSDKANTIDNAVLDASGNVIRSVEVTTVDNPVFGAGDLRRQMGQVGYKVDRRTIEAVTHTPGGTPGAIERVPGEIEGVIRLEFAYGTMQGTTMTPGPGTPTRGTFPPPSATGPSTVFDGFGGHQEYRWNPRTLAPYPKRAEDVLDEILKTLQGGGYTGSSHVKRYRFVHHDHTPIAVIEKNTAGLWELTR